VRLILGWNESPKDMDLHTLQVTKPSGTRSCHTFWRNRNTCASTGVHLDVDNRDGGYNGVETITLSDVADNFQNTYMVWVDDYGGGGSSLEKSGSQVTITDGKNTQIARMPAFGDKTPAGVRFWIVGCVAIIGETYKFVEKSKFTEEDPTMDNEKYCHNYFEENPPTLITPPAFCPKVALEVVSFDPLTNKPVDIDQSVVSLNDGLGWKIVASETDVGSTHSIPLSQDGDYTVSLTAGNIDNGGAINVACNIQKCSECKPKLSVPMLDKAAIVNQSILRLNWESDVDLDLIVSEEIYDTKYREWETYNCLEKSLLPQACEKVTIEATATRGFNQGEAMSIKDDQDKKYLVYVDTHKNEVKQSGAQVKFYSKSTRNGGGNEMTFKSNFETKQYAGQRYWVVGCIGGDTTGDIPYMYFDPYPVFLDKDPITESEYKSYCFGKNG